MVILPSYSEAISSRIGATIRQTPRPSGHPLPAAPPPPPPGAAGYPCGAPPGPQQPVLLVLPQRPRAAPGPPCQLPDQHLRPPASTLTLDTGDKVKAPDVVP